MKNGYATTKLSADMLPGVLDLNVRTAYLCLDVNLDCICCYLNNGTITILIKHYLNKTTKQRRQMETTINLQQLLTLETNNKSKCKLVTQYLSFSY